MSSAIESNVMEDLVDINFPKTGALRVALDYMLDQEYIAFRNW